MFENSFGTNDKSESIVVALVLQNSDVNASLAFSSIAGWKYLTPSWSARDWTWLVCGLVSYLKAIDHVWIVIETFILYPWKGCDILFPQEDASFGMLLRPPRDVLSALFSLPRTPARGTAPLAPAPGAWSLQEVGRREEHLARGSQARI